MTGALLSFSAMAVSIRELAATLSIMEILAVRSGFGLVVMAALTAARADLRATIFTRQLPLHFFRNLVHLGSQYVWATSLLLLPLATVFALEFTAPAWALLLAVPVLGERMTVSRIGAVVLGLIGVLIIVRPGLATFQPAALLVLLAATRIRQHAHCHQETHAHRYHLRDHLLDEPHPIASRLDPLEPFVRDQARVG